MTKQMVRLLMAIRISRRRFVSTVSAAALGQNAGISLGLSSTSLTYSGRLAFGDLPLGPGALRLVAGHPKNFEGYSVGYAAPLARRSLSTVASMTLGAELSVGYLGYRLSGPTAYIGNGTYLNAHLALPVGVQVGNADHLSFAPYVAPYADLGAAPSGYWINSETRETGAQACQDLISCRYLFSGHHQTTTLGAAIGFRMTIWRLGFDAAYGDLPTTRSWFFKNPLTFGASVRL